MTSFAVLAGIALLLLVVVQVSRSSAIAQQLRLQTNELLLGEEAEGGRPCPREFVERIFSREDWESVASTKCPQLMKAFREERKTLALLWVMQTARAIHQVLREHVEASRRNPDLEFGTEVKLVLQYAQLMLICGLLFLAIESAGTVWLGALALQAERLSQGIANVQQSLVEVPAGSPILK